MNVDDQAARPHLRTELHAIERMLSQGKPVLGICLGAQLLAHALGARIGRIATPEIGWYPVEATPQGLLDPVTAPLGASTSVFQWHGCHFEVPDDAVHLARSPHCEQQAFRGRQRLRAAVPSRDGRAADRTLAVNPAYRDELAASGLPHDAAAIRLQTAAHLATMNHRADAVFNGFLDLVVQPDAVTPFRRANG